MRAVIRYNFYLLAGLLMVCSAGYAQSTVTYDSSVRSWTLKTESAEAVFQLTPEGNFVFRSFSDLVSREAWSAPLNGRVSPIRLTAGQTTFGDNSRYLLIGYNRQDIDGGVRLAVDLAGPGAAFRFSVELFDKFAAMRWQTRYRNLRSEPVTISQADMIPLRFEDKGASFRVFTVNQWGGGGHLQNFETFLNRLDPSGYSGAYFGAGGEKCSWIAMRYFPSGAGLFAGFEFNGRGTVSVSRTDLNHRIDFSSDIVNLNHTVQPRDEFYIPAAFIGGFKGDWDEAGYRTQRFVDAMVAKPMHDPNFPYLVWNSWGYEEEISEAVLRRNAQIAASLGVELFVVDLGWARQIGDWRADPGKFPSGLRSLSDYVHSLGMKFGVHFAWVQAELTAPVLRQHPDWTATYKDEYFGAVSLCPSHDPVHDWLVTEAVRMIDEYNLDWIVQDGEGMIKLCEKTSHTHASMDSNYSNAVDGVDALIDEVQALRPQVLWENCQDGGNMMTYAMARRYVTSIAADNSGPLTTRQAVYGITYPFPPRYADRYLPEEDLDSYKTRSYMFSGPLILMNRLASMSTANLQYLANELKIWKSFRSRLMTGKVFHISQRPAEGAWDAIESFDPASASAIVFVYRTGSPSSSYTVRPRGLDPDVVYNVRLQDGGSRGSMSGRQLLEQGIGIELPKNYAAEILYLDPATPQLPATPR